MYRIVLVVSLFALFLAPLTAVADESSEPRWLVPGEFRALAAGGVAIVDRDVNLGMEGSLEVGLLPALTLAGPAALTLRVIETKPGSGLYLSGGITDLSITTDYHVLCTPSLILGSQAILGPESTLRASMDLTTVLRDVEFQSPGAWIRGSVAILIDFGPWATVAAGVSYQRVVAGGGQDRPDIVTAGYVSDSRITLGSVRSQPFYDLPTLSVHISESIDVIAIARFDIDIQRDVNDNRFLVGLEIR